MKDVTNIVINEAALSLASNHGLTVVVNRTDNVAHPRRPEKKQTSTLVTFTESFITALSDVNYKPYRGVSIEDKISIYLSDKNHLSNEKIHKEDIIYRLVYENGDGIPELSINDYAKRPSIGGVRLNFVAGFIYEEKQAICKEFKVKSVSEKLEAEIEARMEAELMKLNEFAQNDLYTLTILKTGKVLECVDFVRYTDAIPNQKYTDSFSQSVTDFIEGYANK